MIARPSRSWLLALGALAGCFVDGGLQTGGGAGSTGDAASTAGPSGELTTSGPSGSTAGPDPTAPATTSGPPPATCGNNIIEAPTEVCDDGNLDDTDACLASCQEASCGDGFVWAGKEQCDEGPNNSNAPDATCRPGCTLPACGDGGFYVGPLGPPIVVADANAQSSQGNDAPRSITADNTSEFLVLWRVEGQVDQVPVRRVAGDGTVGDPFNYQTANTTDIRDPSISAAPNGDVAVVWEAGSNIGMSLRLGGGAPQLSYADIVPNQNNLSPTVALGPNGQGAVAFLGEVGNNTRAVFVRFIPDLLLAAMAPPEAVTSAHLAGEASPPTLAFLPSGAFFVAWSDPTGVLLLRRYGADGQPGPLTTSELRIGSSDQALFSPWTGLAAQPDGSAVLAGLDVGGHLALQRVDPGNTLHPPVQVDEQDPRFVQFVDLASDPWGHLAVAWNACGSPLDLGENNCNNLPQRWRLRWFLADLTPAGPSEQVVDASGTITPVSVAVAPSGAAAVTYIAQARVEARVTTLLCP